MSAARFPERRSGADAIADETMTPRARTGRAHPGVPGAVVPVGLTDVRDGIRMCSTSSPAMPRTITASSRSGGRASMSSGSRSSISSRPRSRATLASVSNTAPPVMRRAVNSSGRIRSASRTLRSASTHTVGSHSIVTAAHRNARASCSADARPSLSATAKFSHASEHSASCPSACSASSRAVWGCRPWRRGRPAARPAPCAWSGARCLVWRAHRTAPA